MSSQVETIRHNPVGAWLALSFVLWAIVLLIFLPPWVGLAGREIIMSAFRPLCHQLPDRSPHLSGVQLAVCHRCLGIYVGLAASATVLGALIAFTRPIEKYASFLLPASLVPLAVDWLGDVVGLWTNTPTSRVATGGVFGAVAGVFLARVLVQAVRQRRSRTIDPGKSDSIVNPVSDSVRDGSA
ncbi:MAG: DUF2085 domain-containing protein [Bacteroidetes bacterium]|nr:DUF2085 domain-containing protein [Bacteroidota bacterium]